MVRKAALSGAAAWSIAAKCILGKGTQEQCTDARRRPATRRGFNGAAHGVKVRATARMVHAAGFGRGLAMAEEPVEMGVIAFRFIDFCLHWPSKSALFVPIVCCK